MQVIINSSIILDDIADLQVNCYSGDKIVLGTKTLVAAAKLELQLLSHNISYTRFGGDNGKVFEISCKSISAYS